MQTKQKFEERVIPELFESTRLTEALNKLGFYNSSEKMRCASKLERSNSCSF